MLAISGDGSLTVLELKRGQTEREVVTQALDYGSWVQTVSRDQLRELYSTEHPGTDLEAAFKDYFGRELPAEDELAGDHKLLIVASSFDEDTERIVTYLAAFGVPINAVFVRYFQNGDHGILARTWLRDPDEVDATSARANKGSRDYGPWNGHDYYVSFDSNSDRDWEDARRYGFVSAGYGRWYTRTLHNLARGNRVFVRAPGQRYIGVGRVLEPARLVEDVHVDGVDGTTTPLLSVELNATTMDHHPGDPDRGETVVRIAWDKTVPLAEAFSQPGLFGNQNTVCKLRDQETIESVARHFGLLDRESRD